MNKWTSKQIKMLKIKNKNNRLLDKYKGMSVNDIAQHIKKRDIAPNELTKEQRKHIESILKE